MGQCALPPAGGAKARRAPGRPTTSLAALAASLSFALSCSDADPRDRPPAPRPPAPARVAPKPARSAAEPPPPHAAAPPPVAPALEPEPPPAPRLLALRKEVPVFAAADLKSPKLGYVRAGAQVERGEKPVGRKGCRGGWYAVKPRGFVCAGAAASLDLDLPVAELARRRPDRDEGLPYEYVISKHPPPPFYLKLPSAAEQRSVEGDAPAPRDAAATREASAAPGPRDAAAPAPRAATLARDGSVALASVKGGVAFASAKNDASAPAKNDAPPTAAAAPDADASGVPAALRDGAVVPSLSPNHYGPGALYEGRALPRSGLALVDRFDWLGRPFGLTTDLLLVPLDRTRPVAASSFRGVELAAEGARAAFVMTKGERLYRKEGAGRLVAEAPLAYREGVALSGRAERVDGANYLETADGRFVRDGAHLRRAEPPASWPAFALEGKKWVDVSVLRQTLVAYVGTRATFATLVSTGSGGLGDPEETHATVRGTFAIKAKHVTATMDSDDLEDRFDLRDVPYVQYFHQGYALHAAYWHDGFGAPRSHGCINLHPRDASWLFRWTDPPVPDDWHGATADAGEGTLVHVRP